MEAIVFIGSATSGSSTEALKIAGRLGYSAILLTDRKAVLRRMAKVAQVIYMESMEEAITQNKDQSNHYNQVMTFKRSSVLSTRMFPWLRDFRMNFVDPPFPQKHCV